MSIRNGSGKLTILAMDTTYAIDMPSWDDMIDGQTVHIIDFSRLSDTGIPTTTPAEPHESKPAVAPGQAELPTDTRGR